MHGRRVRGTTRIDREQQSRTVGAIAGTVTGVVRMRRCTRAACALPAVATLTYVYADSTAVLGPLATYAEPHCYDLCAGHSERLTAPRGWEVVRLAVDPDSYGPTADDLEALADAVREAARPAPTTVDRSMTEVGRRGHLRVLRPVD